MRLGGSGRGGMTLWLPLVACVAVTTPRFLLDSTDSIQRMSLPWAAAMAAWWCLPLLWLVRAARSEALVWIGATAYVAFAGMSLAATYRDTHSTAAFGIFFWPPYLAAGVALILGIEALVNRRRRRPEE